MMRALLGAVCLTVIAALAVQVGLAGGKLDPVKIQATASKPDAQGKQTVTVQITIAKGWHIYANPVDHEDFAEAQTVVALKAGGKNVGTVKYPAGKTHT